MAVDGVDALARVMAYPPDLMLLDLMMPNLDGFEVCRRLRAESAFKDLPVLVQSSLNRAEDRARAFAAGATDYVSKPINAVELISRVRIHIQNRMLLQSLQLFHQRTTAELHLASRLQERLLPQPPQLAQIERSMGVRVEALFSPSSELGGDFWDIRPLDEHRLAIWLVDFSGHGVGAALNTFRLHAITRQLDFDELGPVDFPAQFLATINRRLCALLPQGQYATMLVGVLDLEAGQFTYASAASTRPMAWNRTEATPVLGDNRGLPLGLLASASYETRTLPFPTDGRLLFYSDAAIEIPVGTDVLDDVGLRDFIVDIAQLHPDPPFLGGVLEKLNGLSPQGFDDDLTLLVLSRCPR
jgi:sigma-B regulation protein RsbU (phosphoserine phosphatase)